MWRQRDHLRAPGGHGSELDRTAGETSSYYEVLTHLGKHSDYQADTNAILIRVLREDSAGKISQSTTMTYEYLRS